MVENPVADPLLQLAVLPDRAEVSQKVCPAERPAHNRGQFGCNSVKNQGQQVGESKLQQRGAEGYQVELDKLPKGTISKSPVDLFQKRHAGPLS